MQLTKQEIVGLIFGIAPFYVHLGYFAETTLNGQTTTTFSLNVFAIIGAVAAFVSAMQQRKSLQFEGAQYTPQDKTLHKIIIVVLIVLGIVQSLNFIRGILGFV